MQAAPDSVTLVLEKGEIRFRRFRVRVLSGSDQGIAAVSSGMELTVGAAPGNDVTLRDRAVSRHHLSITATPEGYLLRDLGSRNGTWVAGLRAEAVYLKPDTLIGAGETTLRFEATNDDWSEPLSETPQLGRLIGVSPAMRRIFALIPRLAQSDATVLIEAETGTGKGLIAEAIHQASPRAAGPFVVIDCGAIPFSLVESELFGHERGAFTGAHVTRPGAFEVAYGGTVFLDEIGELPLDLQPRLLRVLEERIVKRVGSHETTRVDVRILAATNRDLRKEVNRGTFRPDLYYRLNVVRLDVPPLRERREDIPVLAEAFWHQLAGPDAGPLPPHLIAHFTEQEWPGNVRELRATIERSLLMGEDLTPPASPKEAGPGFDPALSFRDAKSRATGEWEKQYFTVLMHRCEFNLSRAAREARMDRTHLRELLLRYEILRE